MRLLAIVSFVSLCVLCDSSDILLITLGGTKSHKIGFWELARGLIAKNHNVTFINAFTPDFHMDGLEEITPANLVFFVRNFTNWDLVGPRMRGEEPVTLPNVIHFASEVCRSMLEDPEFQEFMLTRKDRYDLVIMDGAYPECTSSIAYKFQIPFMYLNTVAFNTVAFSKTGNPVPYSITPFMNLPYTDDMSLKQRIVNTVISTGTTIFHYILMYFWVYPDVRKYMGNDVPDPYELTKQVSFILQFGHHSVNHPRPFLPNVAEVGCLHCKPAKPLRKDLEDFIEQGGENGFIFFSMGSSVKASNMPENLRKMLVKAFARLPYQVLWKWESDPHKMVDLPHNVMLSRWLPQQDLLGHRKIRAFITHGGLLSLYETVYHGVPIVTMPVFCDHDSNAMKAVADGYAIKIELPELTTDLLVDSVNKIIKEPSYREAVKQRQIIFKDMIDSPINIAMYWIEYVMRHKGAHHLKSPARNLNFLQYYSIDTICIVIGSIFFILSLVSWLIRNSLGYLYDLANGTKKVKRE